MVGNDCCEHCDVFLRERDDARRERDEARADSKHWALRTRDLDIQLQAATAENAALKAELAEVRADAKQVGQSMEQWAVTAAGATKTLLALRARLERAEAVVDAVLSGRAYKVDEALAAWRKPP